VTLIKIASRNVLTCDEAFSLCLVSVSLCISLHPSACLLLILSRSLYLAASLEIRGEKKRERERQRERESESEQEKFQCLATKQTR